MSGCFDSFENGFRSDLEDLAPAMVERRLRQFSTMMADGSFELGPVEALQSAVAVSTDVSILMLRRYYEWTEQGPARS